MSLWPPPNDEPVVFAADVDADVDPWVEQARRHEQYRLEQRRLRRRRWLSLTVAAAAVVLVGAGGATLFTVRRSVTAPPSQATISGPGQPAAIDRDSVVNDLGTTAEGGESTEAAAVDEVWLLGRGDGTFDWGSLLSSNSDVVREDLAVTMVVFDDDANEVFTTQVTVAQLAPDGVAAVGGTFRADAGTTTRIELTVTSGAELPDAVAAEITVSDVRRVSAGQVDSDDRLLGAVEVMTGERGPIRVAALWRNDGGDVIASVFTDLAAVEVGESAGFSLRLRRGFVPPGEPDTVMAMVGASS